MNKGSRYHSVSDTLIIFLFLCCAVPHQESLSRTIDKSGLDRQNREREESVATIILAYKTSRRRYIPDATIARNNKF